MDKLKEKLGALRAETDAANARADDSEYNVKKLRDQLAAKEAELSSLNNKVHLLTLDFERAEKRIDEVKVQNQSETDMRTQLDALNRKVALLEKDLATTEGNLRQTSERLRVMEMTSEQFERKANLLEREKEDTQAKLDQTMQLYNKTKKELEETLKQLEDL